MKNVTSKIENLPTHLNSMILQNLSFTEHSFGQKSKTNYLFNIDTGVTFTGLIPYVILLLQKINEQYEIIDMRTKPESNANFNIDPNFSPRDYQKNIIDNISSREIIQAATGAGKTYIMAEIIAKYDVKPVLVMAPKVSLAMQIQEEFTKFLNTKVGICGGGFKDIQDITICTPQSVPQELTSTCKLLMWDEFHNASADFIQSVSNKCINAFYRYGVSATPWRDDNKDMLLEAIANKRKPHLSINASKLIDKGKLVPCTIEFITINEIFPWEGNYNALYQKAIVHNTKRNNIIVDKAVEEYKNGEVVLILIKNIEHGKLLLNMLRKRDEFISNSITNELLNDDSSEIQFISGEDSNDHRNKILNKVKAGEVKILIGSTIADEGLDLPILSTLILAGGGRSSTRAFQRVGRVLRLYPGKTKAKVYDFKDMTPSLYNHYQVRKALYETEPRWEIIEK
jgi:superfamily II DNA or RNA helicase